MDKPVKYKIIFEGEYTEKERDLLWGRFFMELVKLQDKQQGGLTPCKTY
jgi:hypothetical protein